MRPKPSGWSRKRSWGRVEWTPAQKRYVLARDARVCHVCGSQTATDADHVIPLAEGGSTDPDENGRAICDSCHTAKSREEALRGYRRMQAAMKLPPEPHPFKMEG